MSSSKGNRYSADTKAEIALMACREDTLAVRHDHRELADNLQLQGSVPNR